MPALLPQSNLQTVVARRRLVRLFTDIVITRERSRQRGLGVSEFAVARELAGRQIGCQRELIDWQDYILMPSKVSNILAGKDERRHDLTLQTDAELRDTGSRIVGVECRHALRHYRQLRL